jgi:predicted aminopeptidase
VYVGGAAAYSTLGWLDDPVLSTMIERSPTYLAEVLFHELAHQVVYAADDTAFNEAFATAVAEIGVSQWLVDSGRGTPSSYSLQRNRRRELFAMLSEVRGELDSLYASALGDSEKLERKAGLLGSIETRYAAMRATWDQYRGYDAWVRRDWNNARLALISTYHGLTPAFHALFNRVGRDLDAFYEAVRALATMPKQQRHDRLRKLQES